MQASSSLIPKGNTYRLSLKTSGVIGVNPHERLMAQLLEVDLKIRTKGAAMDVFLPSIERLILDIVATQKPFLIEHLCYKIAIPLMEKYRDIENLQLTIKKPEALKNAKYAYATIRIQRKMS